MVAFLRQFLVVLLVLLQNAVPLVHAHAGGDFSQVGGIHLYEFESLHFSSGHVSVSTAGQRQDAESCIVIVGSAIKSQQADCSGASALVSLAGEFVQPVAGIPSSLAFPSPVAGFIVRSVANYNSPRAPPLFFC
jgi:hypothetical protein